MLSALRERVEAVGLELKDIDGLDPPRFAVVRDDADDGCYALTHHDGLPLFSFQEVHDLVREIEAFGSFEKWRGDGEEDVLPDIFAWRRQEERQYVNRVYAEALNDTHASTSGNQNLRDEIRVIVIQELMRHKLIASTIPFDGEVVPPKK